MMETILFSFEEVKMAQNPAYKPAVFLKIKFNHVSKLILLL